ncbi:MAG: hypothetical protein M3Z09_10545 [Acidobacteriota bacterium]|nr:hypothetical protein [Acidobacteriota bacterium]
MKTFSKFVFALALAAALLHAAERFDNLVRGDFFSGFAGDATALDRAMKVCEETLAANPQHAEALVWHGSGNVFLSGQAFRKGDYARGSQLWGKGLREMDDAVALEPGRIAVLIPRGATLLNASAALPNPEQARPLLEKGVTDYEKVLAIQKPYFDTISGHSRGELLFGLADGYNRLNRKDQARSTFETLLSVGKASGHEAQARQWMEKGSYEKSQLSCTGCHTGK